MAHEKVLVVEDEQDILELLTYNLEKEGYRTVTALTGEEALERVSEDKPDLILLDLLLPGLDGLEVCRRLKHDDCSRDIPILMVTAKGEDSDIITGLEIGADDYITKPFSPKVLIARIRSSLRRKTSSPEEKKNNKITIGEITIDISRHRVTCRGKYIHLSATQFAILVFLAQNPDWVFSRNQIIESVKGGDYPVTERSVDVQILGLRKKLGELGKYIQTVRGFGYTLKVE